MCEEIMRSQSDSKGASLSPHLDKFKEKQDKLPWQKRVTGSNLTENQLDKVFVKLETIRHLLFTEKSQNLAKYHQQTQNNQPEASTEVLPKLELENSDVFAVFKYLNRDLQLEKAQIMNILLKFTDDDDVQREDEQQDIDDTLLWLIKDYIRLSSLPSLNETDTKQMLSILELAQIDNELDEWISRIDTALVETLEGKLEEKLGLPELESITNQTKKSIHSHFRSFRFKKIRKFVRYRKQLDNIL